MPIPVGIGASRGAAVLGLSKFKSPLAAWLEIMEARKPGFCEANGYELPRAGDEWGEPLDPKMAPIRWGHAFETAICDMVGGITDREQFLVHPDHDFITCHLDGLKDDRVQENKTAFDMAFKMGWGKPGSAEIPDGYQIQVQHQMLLAGVDRADVNVLVFPKSPAQWEAEGYRVGPYGRAVQKDNDLFVTFGWAVALKKLGFFHQFHVEANQMLQKEIVDRYLAFWVDNVVREMPPPIEGYSDIKWLFPSPEGEIEASTEIAELWSELIDGEDEIASIQARNSEIKGQFVRFAEEAKRKRGIKNGNEKGKLNIYHGARKLFSISRRAPRYRVSKSTTETISEDSPELYERMKKTSFLNLIGPEFTEKQAEAVSAADGTSEAAKKVVEKFKLTKLLSRQSIISALKKREPELYEAMKNHRILELSEAAPRLTINRPEKEK